MKLFIMRTVGMLLQPAAVILGLVLAGVFLRKRRPRLGMAMVIAGVLLFYLLGISPVAHRLASSLESGYRQELPDVDDADAIVVLAGDTKVFGGRAEPGMHSLVRTARAVQVYRARPMPLLFSGGSGDPSRPEVCTAETMARTAIGLGIPEADIRTECASTDTLTNAIGSAKLLGKKRIVLVTSAYHMKRSERVFAKQGFSVIPAPAGFQDDDEVLSVRSFIPSAQNLALADSVFHEYIGHAWYAVRGAL